MQCSHFILFYFISQEKGKEVIQHTGTSQTLENTPLCVLNGKTHTQIRNNYWDNEKIYGILFYPLNEYGSVISRLGSTIRLYSLVFHRLCTATFHTKKHFLPNEVVIVRILS